MLASEPFCDMSNTMIGMPFSAAERDRRGVHHTQVFGHHFHVRDLVVLDRIGFGPRIGAVDAVDTRVRALDQRVSLDFGRSQRRSGVGREERVARTRGEDDDAALLEVPDGAPTDVGLGDARHLDRRLHTGLLALTLERILQCQGVHHRPEHPDVVRLRRVHAGERAFPAPPEVAAADHDRNVDTEVLAEMDDLGGRGIERRPIEPGAGIARECLARRFEDDPLEARARRVSHRCRLRVGSQGARNSPVETT